MKRLAALFLTLAMLLSLVVVPVSADESDVTLTITPDKTEIVTTGEQEVTYTIGVNVKSADVKIGSIQFTLNPPEGMTLATDYVYEGKNSFSYWESDLEYDKKAETGIFDIAFDYTVSSKTFIAVGTTNDRNLHENKTLMTIKAKVAVGTTGNLTLNAIDVEFGKVDGDAVKWTHTVSTTPVVAKDGTIDSVSATVAAPAKGVALANSATIPTGSKYTGSVEWYKGTAATGTTVTGTAQAGQVYTAKVTLTANTDESFVSALNNTTTADGYAVTWNSATQLTLTKAFEKTAEKDTPTITTTAIYVTYKDTVGDSVFSGFTAKFGETDVPGTFTWENVTSYGDAGSKTLTAKFTPSDENTYAVVNNIPVSVTVKQKTLSDVTVEAISDKTYTGSAITPTVTVTSDGITLVKDADYTLSYANNTEVGTATVTVTAKSGSNYTFTEVTEDFTINRATADITINNPGTITYDGQPVEAADVKAVKSSADLYYNYSGDGTVTTKWYADNSGTKGDQLECTPTNAGTYWLGVSAEAGTNYAAVGEVTKKFTISPKAITPTVSLSEINCIYTGSAMQPTVTVKDGNTALTSADYTVSYADNTNAGEATATVTLKGNYSGTASATFTIKPATLTMTATVESKGYDGTTAATIKPGALSGIMTDDAEKVSVKETSIAGAFNDQYVGTDKAVTANSNFTLTGDKAENYTLTQPTELTGSITAATNTLTSSRNSEGSAMSLTKGGNTLDLKSLVSMTAGDTYKDKLTFELVTDAPAGTTLSGSTLTSGSTTGTAAIKVNCATIDVNSDSNAEYNAADELAIYVKIVDKTVNSSAMKVTQSDVEYGTELNPTVSGKPDNTGDVTYTYAKENGGSYNTCTTAPTELGTYKVTAQCESGTVIYKAETTFEITRKTLTASMVGSITAQDYTGSAITPAPVVTVGEKALTKDTDYTVTYANNTNAGSATVTVTGTGNYQGAVTKTFTINKVAPTVTAPAAISELVYDGTAQALATAGSVTGGTMQYSLTANGEYTAAVPTATNAGSYTVWYRVVGDANHTNVDAKAIANVVISPKPLTAATITVADQTYTGAALTPAVTVEDGEKTLVLDTDYTVAYENNTNAGTAGVTVNYTGNYSGTQTAHFTISAKSISDVAVTVAEQTYTGSALTPAVTVKDGEKTLVLDTDYTVAYENNTNAGTAGVTITGTGNYNGTATANFTIEKAVPTGAPKYTLITESGKTLTDAALTLSGSTLSPNAGTLVWLDDDGNTLENDTIVEADTAYKWLFTPENTNYAPLSGLVMLYNASGISEIVNVADDIDAVPDTLKGNSSLNTPEKIKTEMQGKLTAKSSKLTASNTVFMDVTMTIIGGNGTVRSAKASDLVDGKITVLLPFPEAVKASYSKYNFTVAHMITMAGLSGVQVGDVEFPAVTVTADGLQVTLTGLSPVAVSYTETSSSGSSSGRRHYTSSIPAITAEKTSDKAASATDYTSGIYGLTFRSTASYASFKGVQVDGKTLAAENYIVEEGTIEVYLKAAYLQTLATGKHTVTILSSEGNASMDFTIGGVSSSPRTFDAGIAMYVAMATASVTGMAWLGKKRED